jgi:hypothetical protein
MGLPRLSQQKPQEARGQPFPGWGPGLAHHGAPVGLWEPSPCEPLGWPLRTTGLASYFFLVGFPATGGPDEHLPSTAGVHRTAWRGGLADCGARAQRGDRVRRIGVLQPTDENEPEQNRRHSEFRQSLAALGWTDGHVRMDVRWGGDDNNRIRGLARNVDIFPPGERT